MIVKLKPPKRTDQPKSKRKTTIKNQINNMQQTKKTSMFLPRQKKTKIEDNSDIEDNPNIPDMNMSIHHTDKGGTEGRDC